MPGPRSMVFWSVLLSVFVTASVLPCAHAAATALVDVSGAKVVVRPAERLPAEKMAATVLVEEVKKRTGLKWAQSAEWPDEGPLIVIALAETNPPWPHQIPQREGQGLPEHNAEGFRLFVQKDTDHSPIVWIIGADARGTLFGAGEFLRRMAWNQGKVQIEAGLDICTSPAYPIRGHQLGYRNTANAYDAWDAATYEQYIRELVIFGANCIENIPSQDDAGPHLPVPRSEMNVAMSKICERYGIDYWVWVPATFDLSETERRAKSLDIHEGFFKSCPLLSAVFIPGGDPGNNHPDLLLPYAADMAVRLEKHHPKAKIWISLQGFTSDAVDAFFAWVDTHEPEWFGGVVHGPSSPSMANTRRRLAPKYKLRHYPDITHSLICQYPVYWWDQAYALTLGREGPNPQPAWYTHVHNWYAPWTDGFLTYSDGINDDVNKAIWSRLGWNPDTEPRQTCIEYANVFFGSDVAIRAADGIL
ncbi:MAG: hypothetical protein U9Q79_10740, partial [Candidatus Hydrogenedentes bacterium]|nr:hypothetical protein [Candidatus Hydrogenedentota bacterium]